MPKAQSSIGIVTAIGAITAVVFSWNAWNSVKIISVGEQVAAIAQSMENTSKNLAEYQKASDDRSKDQGEAIVRLQIVSGTTNEIVKLLGERQQINSAAVEARVTKQIQTEEKQSSTTAVYTI